MTYEKVKIYFLSGTGNSYRVASWLHDECVQRNISSELIPIDSAKPKEEIGAGNKSLVAFAFPTHGLLPPWSAIKFLFKMPVKKGAHFFTIPTRGAFRIGPVLIPGIAGVASMLPSLLLPFKGYNVRGSVSFDMPVNMTSVHSKLSDKKIDRIIGDARKKAGRFFPTLLDGKTIWFTLNNLWEYFWGLLLLILLPFFPIIYLLIGRFFMGKLHFANFDCIGCGACAKACPNDAIVMKGKTKKRPFWRYNCEVCLRCMNYCRQKAVEAGHSWGVLLAFLTSFPLSVHVFRWLGQHYPAVEAFKNYWTSQMVNVFYIYPVIIFAYFIFYYLLRVKWINKFFTNTTFTRLFRRYHEPGTTLSHLLKRKQ